MNTTLLKTKMKCIGKNRYILSLISILSIIGIIGGVKDSIFPKAILDIIDPSFRILFSSILVLILVLILIFSFYLFYNCNLENDQNITSKALLIIHESWQRFLTINLISEAEKIAKVITKSINSSPYKSGENYDWGSAKINQHKFFSAIELKDIPQNIFIYGGIVEIPLSIHLGHLFTDSTTFRFFHRQRDDDQRLDNWKWPRENIDPQWGVNIKPKLKKNYSNKIVWILVEESGIITQEDLEGLKVPQDEIIRITVKNPGLSNLQCEKQILEIGKKFRNVLETIKQCKEIHLFAYTTPSTSFYLGQNISQTRHLKINVYYYNRSKYPRYELAIILNE